MNDRVKQMNQYVNEYTEKMNKTMTKNEKLLRKTLFDVNIDGYSRSKDLISSVKLEHSSWDGWTMTAEILESEDFYALNMIQELQRKEDGLIQIIHYDSDGNTLKTLKFRIDGLSYSGNFAWSAVDELHSWNVEFYVTEVKDE